MMEVKNNGSLGIIISTDEGPGLWIKSFAIINLRGVSTQLYFNLIFIINKQGTYDGSCYNNIIN